MAKGKVITIAQQKGGSGKTTLAVNLGVMLARAGHSVAFLDTDPQGSLGRWFMTRHEAGRADGMEFSTSSAWGVGYEVGKLRDMADFVIIDTPPKADSATCARPCAPPTLCWCRSRPAMSTCGPPTACWTWPAAKAARCCWC